ncbi:MAG: undecaprenyl-diphosphate phosphatase [Verrucomicrobia bacterium]|nr:MAG: undecaprenyl-diphosphate phosphatase [Verrucomicrobiota bacterium]
MIQFLFSILILSTLTIYGQNEQELKQITNNQTQSSSTLSYLDAAILGTIQGITEFLPISSTGHLIITNHILHSNSNTPPPQKTFDDKENENDSIKNASDSYLIVIQGGTFLAVLFFYWKRIRSILSGLLGRNPKGQKLARNILLAFLPAAITGLLFGKLIEKYLFSPHTIMIALILGALLMFNIEKLKILLKIPPPQNPNTDLEDLTIWQSLTIGGLQCLAMCPGTSRSMVTILGGYLSGLTISKAAEFSFLLGFITLSSATTYKLLTEGTNISRVLSLGPTIFGCSIAFITGAIVIKWLINFLNSHGLSLFAWYRLFLALAIFFFIK